MFSCEQGGMVGDYVAGGSRAEEEYRWLLERTHGSGEEVVGQEAVGCWQKTPPW